MITAIFRELLPDFDFFGQYFQEKSIYWDEEEFDYASFLSVNFFKKSSESRSVDDILESVYDNADDVEFVDTLFKKTVSSSDETEKLIISKTKNWDLDRIALIDMILMKMAITEILNFKQIPVKVSMNEYIDIMKK